MAALREARRHGLLLRPDDGSWDAALDDPGGDAPRVVEPPAALPSVWGRFDAEAIAGVRG